MSSTSILELKDCRDADSLTHLLSLLFEPSPPLHHLLVPSVLLRLTATSTPPPSYAALIDICADVASCWTYPQKAEFLSGHPMIGEQKNLSALSGKEQGQGAATPPVVLKRYVPAPSNAVSHGVLAAKCSLEHLNRLYCIIFPGLRYLTFVNGRSRAEIIPEFEHICDLLISPTPLPDDFDVESPPLDSIEVEKRVRDPAGQAWRDECERGLADVWRIGKARLKTMGVE